MKLGVFSLSSSGARRASEDDRETERRLSVVLTFPSTILSLPPLLLPIGNTIS
jgi:hypothetical protein